MKVKSKNISEIYYSEGDLLVTFTSGRTYRYLGVPEEIYTELASVAQSDDADASVGKAFHRLVRSQDFDYEEQ